MREHDREAAELVDSIVGPPPKPERRLIRWLVYGLATLVPAVFVWGMVTTIVFWPVAAPFIVAGVALKAVGDSWILDRVGGAVAGIGVALIAAVAVLAAVEWLTGL